MKRDVWCVCQRLAFIVVTVAAGYYVKKASKDQTNIRAKKTNRQLKRKQLTAKFQENGIFLSWHHWSDSRWAAIPFAVVQRIPIHYVTYHYEYL